MRHGNPHQHPLIKRARRIKEAAASSYRRAVRLAQATCLHPEVLEAPYQSSEWFNPLPAMRVCRVCGLHEYDRRGTERGRRAWDSPAMGPCNASRDYSKQHRLTTEFVKYVTRDEAGKYRRP